MTGRTSFRYRLGYYVIGPLLLLLFVVAIVAGIVTLVRVIVG